MAEYVWIDGSGNTLRSKSRTLTTPVNSIADLPKWNFDGSSCYMASTHNSEVILKPVFYCKDPFREGDNLIVLCDTWIWANNNFTHEIPANTNFRVFAQEIFDAVKDHKPWYGLE
jgi:glutamine synthetase